MLAGIHITKNGAQHASLIQEGLRWSQTQLGSIFFGVVAPVIILVAINFICFYRTINGYFAADDFVHVAYLFNVFNGHPELLWQNFVGNWMQAEGTQFYRPFISLTLAWDYLIGGTNGFVYHLSNTLYQIASTVFLFLLVSRLAVPIAPFRARMLAFFAAALFAASPLHCEVVSWVIGRVDSVCTAFYLASFWLFLKGHQERSRGASVAAIFAFIISLMSIEMAVTLPAAATLFVAMEPAVEGRRISIVSRLQTSLRATWPLWLTLLIMLGIRTAALGTLTGGYSGSVGDSLTNSIWHRLFGDGSVMRIFYPFNSEVFTGRNPLSRTLTILYALTAGTALLRFLWFKYEAGFTRLIPFALLWFLMAMAPTYQVFNIAPSLQCSRFVYLGTAPLCLLLAALLLPLAKTRRTFFQASTGLGVLLLLAFVFCYTGITQRNNQPWAQAADQVRAFRNSIERTLHEMPANQKLVIINVPERSRGAHMIYNGSMLNTLLSPPLSKERLIDRVISFEPAMWGEPDMINASRLRGMIGSPDYRFFGWDMGAMKLYPVEFQARTDADQPLPSYDFTPTQFANSPATASGLTVVSPVLKLNAPDVDAIQVSMSTKARTGEANGFLVLSWKNAQQANFPASQKLALPVVADGTLRTYKFNVSEHKSWMLSGVIERLALDCTAASGGTSINLQSIQVENAKSSRPLLQPNASSWTAGNDGTFYPQQGANLAIDYDAGAIDKATALRFEISYANTWFEHYTGTLRDTEVSRHAWKSFTTNDTKGSINLDRNLFTTGGFYEVRAFAIGPDGSIIGVSSDPITVQMQMPPAKAGSGAGG